MRRGCSAPAETVRRMKSIRKTSRSRCGNSLWAMRLREEWWHTRNPTAKADAVVNFASECEVGVDEEVASKIDAPELC